MRSFDSVNHLNLHIPPLISLYIACFKNINDLCLSDGYLAFDENYIVARLHKMQLYAVTVICWYSIPNPSTKLNKKHF